eukprot:TRINITY_DN670_c0_g2_i1.p1 TRINITY_DN670_c0_g2~~TRINITY_DN670_c0_g2_i1.p1  ORF type:complete len:436 (+),score=87.30 TRINITY_DN670_c0_g2_i1:652-1959(+)
MKFMRTNENGRIVWKKEPKEELSPEQIRKIEAMDMNRVKMLPTEDKCIWLYSTFDIHKHEAYRNLRHSLVSPLVILVERTHFLRDSFEQLRTITHLDLRRRVRIHFVDEIAQDAGGLIREWLAVLVEELFAESLGLFVRTKTEEVAYSVNVQSGSVLKNHLEYFYFCGQILGKALFERIPVKAYLSKFLLKKLTSEELISDDLKYLDTELWKSVKYLESNKLEDEIGTFAITQKSSITYSEEQIELKPNGSSIPLNEETKEEFISLFCDYYLKKSVESQFTELAFGFFSVVPGDVLAVLDCHELELLLCGEQEISLSDWRANTVYADCYENNHRVIEWFWRILSKLTSKELESFLQFCTGSTRPPAEGFAGLTNLNELCLFTIAPMDYMNNGTDFPVAHTCFNKLELPLYPTEEDMEKAMRLVIANPYCHHFSSE